MGKAFIHVGLLLGFFIGMVAVTYLLWWLWAPLAAIPFLVYTIIAVRYNARKCWCGHRYISHNAMASMCLSCKELTFIFHDPKETLELQQ